jgi:hypothetical protein
MSAQDPLHALLPYLPLLIVMIILFRRTQRPRTLNPSRLWIGPVIVLVILGIYLNGAIKLASPPHPMDWLVIVGTGVVGAVLGAVRAHSVHLQLHPESGAVEARLSAWGLFVIVAWVAGRMLLRQSGVVDVNSPFGLYNESAMSLALGAVVAQAIVLTRRCRALLAENIRANGSEPAPAGRSTSDKLPGSAV